MWSAVGRRIPVATTALGRAILAATPDGRPGTGTGTDTDTDETLGAIIDEARQQGYATETEENEPGIACVAVALVRAGRPVAAVSITAPVERMTGPARAERVAALRDVLTRTLPVGLSLPAVGSRDF